MLFKIDTKNDAEVRNGLIKLCEGDCDMNGENGEEYLWHVAKEAGYENNAEYLADVTMKKEISVKEMFEQYAKEVFNTGYPSWYKGYDVEFLEDGDVLTVAFYIW